MQTAQHSQRTVLRCPELWFSKDTIVIQAGDMQFKVHTDVLTRQSEVFRDLLSLPQPAGAETVDGSPLVRIEGTTAADMRLFLGCMHDSTEYSAAMHDYVKVATLLRMSHKYQAVDLHRHILADLSPIFPTTLDGYKYAETDAQLRRALFDYSLPDCSVTLANAFRDVRAMHFLPVTLYRLCRCSVKDVLNSALLAENLRAVIIGRSLLAAYAKEMVFSTVTAPDSNARANDRRWSLQDACNTRSLCPQYLRDVFAVLLEHDCWLDPLATRDSKLTFRDVCSYCTTQLVQEYETGRAATWDVLPEFFELPSWSTLREERP